MEEKVENSKKILKDKKVSIKASTCWFIAGTCFLLSAVIGLFIGDAWSTNISYLGAAVVFLVLAMDARKKEKLGENPKEDAHEDR